ncbi:acyl-CoA transferase/dehydratase domain protein [Mycobacterium kansasii]|uniref:Acyl-CoA transferase/dehydratase domain protein n=1 Tax=Mycobacterium kansasii TaxID=1768 RepID=A0A1V3X2Y2_MYCKA|nr:acyl-CoA transferase/dehydratase domain protein [Mycobacterium kansasii]
MKELVAAGQAHGVPIAAVLTPSRILASEHFQAVGAITDAELVPGVHAQVPTGYFTVNEQRAGFRAPAPTAGQHEPGWLADPVPAPRLWAGWATIRSPDCAFSISASSSPAAS